MNCDRINRGDVISLTALFKINGHDQIENILTLSMSSNYLTPDYSSTENLSRLIVEHLEQKEQLFKAVNNLVNQLHNTQLLLEENKPKEALLKVEQLVSYGETITREI